jgi:hypothetical protein
MKPKLIALTVLTMALLTGCDRALLLKTPLESDEKIAKGDIVLLDGAPAGAVTRVATTDGQRTADLVITDEGMKSKLRVGIVRLREDGRIFLRTDAVDAQAPPLANGAVIPLVSKPALAIRQFTTGRMLPGVLVGLAIVLVALLLFRRLARGWMLLLTLCLSGAMAWVALPWTTGAVAKVYSLVPSATGGTDTAQKMGFAQAVSRFIANPPDAQAVAYAAVFVVAFVILCVALRCALARIENRVI